MTKVLYPGSFDPITRGHMDIIKQASLLFDEVVVGVFNNYNKKNSFFNLEERLQIIEELYKDNDLIKVVTGVGATIDVAKEYDCRAIVRGLRSLSDYDYEVGLASINKDLSQGNINTVCLFADNKYQFISSSMVKEVFSLDKDISSYVDLEVKDKMLSKKLGDRM